jgi:hypothetical protein
MRLLFTDGANSFFHVLAGFMSGIFWQIIPLFLGYQLIDYNDSNLIIDLSEFAIGFMLNKALNIV